MVQPPETFNDGRILPDMDYVYSCDMMIIIKWNTDLDHRNLNKPVEHML